MTSTNENKDIKALRLKLEQAEKELPADGRSLVPLLNDWAKAMSDHGRFEEAEEALRRVLAIEMAATGPESLETAQALNALAVNYCYRYRYYEAIPLFERALYIRKRHLGSNHPEIAKLLNNIGSLYNSLGRYGESEESLRQAWEIYGQHGLERSESALKTLNNMIGLYKNTDRNQLAEETAARMFQLAEAIITPDHVLYANVLNNYSEALALNRKMDEALELVQRAMAIKRKQAGDHHELIYYYMNLANIYKQQDRFIEAEAVYHQAMEFGKRVLEPTHPLVGMVHLGLGDMYRLNQEPRRAETEYLSAIGILERSLGADHPDVAEARYSYGCLLLEENQAESADALFQKSLKAMERAYGPSHPKVREILSRLAQSALEMGEVERARDYLKRLNKISRQEDGSFREKSDG